MARKEDALQARWDLVALERGMLTPPLSKSCRPRHVPLSPAMDAGAEGASGPVHPRQPARPSPSRVVGASRWRGGAAHAADFQETHKLVGVLPESNVRPMR